MSVSVPRVLGALSQPWVRVLALILCVSGFSPAIASAQSHWGASVSMTPEWTSHDRIRETILGFEGEGSIEGKEFTVGVVRGSTRGGDWGVSYINKPFTDGSGTVNIDGPLTETRRMQGVLLKGVEVHWFAAIATIKDRVQIGVNIAGGIASVEGVVTETDEYNQPANFFPPNFNPCSFAGQLPDVVSCERTPGGYKTVALRDAQDILPPKMPLGKIEAAGTVILHPSLKVRISGGFNMPSSSAFRVGVVYLIGAK